MLLSYIVSYRFVISYATCGKRHIKCVMSGKTLPRLNFLLHRATRNYFDFILSIHLSVRLMYAYLRGICVRRTDQQFAGNLIKFVALVCSQSVQGRSPITPHKALYFDEVVMCEELMAFKISRYKSLCNSLQVY